MRISTVFVGWFFGIVFAAQTYSLCNQPLLAPPGYYQTVEVDKNKTYACPSAPKPFTDSLEFNSKYEGSDSARATLNEASDKAYRDAVENIRQLEKVSAEIARDYVRGAGIGARECLLDLLDTWAKADALLADDVNHVGEAVRKWALASTGSAYLQIMQLRSGLPPADDAKRVRIENWFSQLTQPIMDYYSDRPIRKVNNHDYWAAWSVMVTAVNLQDCDLYAWSMKKFTEGIGQIDGQGYLPNELRRKSRALNYQNYALQPLVMLASFAKANGETLNAETDSLARLVNAVLQGIHDPGIYAVMTGEEQIMDGVISGWSLAWVQPWTYYCAEQPQALLSTVPVEHFSSTRLGGDLERLFDQSISKEKSAIKPVLPVK